MNLPTYFEVLAPSHDLLTKEFECDLPISLPTTPIFYDPPTHTSMDLHEEHPMVEVGDYYLCSDPAWEICAPHVTDPDVFTVMKFEL